MNSFDEYKIAVIGLGYVGFPLFKSFSSVFMTKGVDKSANRIEKIKSCSPNMLTISTSWEYVRDCNFYIITVPTPVDKDNFPNISSLKQACIELGRIIKPEDIIVLESTVYPGLTNEVCVPILEEMSGMKVNIDFHVGYSPERINVGDQQHQFFNTPKIISSDNDKSLQKICHVYKSVIKAPIIKASSIKVAEAAKMYENVQRDMLIALANEFSEYCKVENINIEEVTKCASSKWNFADVYPGLVGGHCIGVDPYYLLYRASEKGIDLPLIQNARQTNENKPLIIAKRISNLVRELNLPECAKVLLLGFSYKPNNGDTRNTKVAVVMNELKNRGLQTDCFDPLVNNDEVYEEYRVRLLSAPIDFQIYSLVVVMVEHDVFAPILQSCSKKTIIHLSSLL